MTEKERLMFQRREKIKKNHKYPSLKVHVPIIFDKIKTCTKLTHFLNVSIIKL